MAAQLAPVADNRAPVGQLAEPTRENVEAVAAFVAELKNPSIPWRDILSAHTRSVHMNTRIQDSMKVQQVVNGWRASLDLPNSYAWNDGWRVQASSDVFDTAGGAKSDLFRTVFATLLLRAPGPVVRMDPSAFEGGSVACASIWEKVRELKMAPLQMQWLASQDAAAAAPPAAPVAPPAAAPPAVAGVTADAALDVAPAVAAWSLEVTEFEARLGQIDERLGLLDARLGLLEHAAAPPAVAASSPERLGQIEARLDRLEEVLPRIVMLEEALDGGLARIEEQLADFGRGHDGARGNDEGSGHEG